MPGARGRLVVTGTRSHLEWLHQALARTALLKRVGVLGLDAAGGDSHEIRVLNRVLRVSAAGVRYEADPRHAEILAALLPPATHSLSTPGVRETFGVPAAGPDPQVFSLDGACGPHGAGWSFEEEEEQEGEGQKAAAQEEGGAPAARAQDAESEKQRRGTEKTMRRSQEQERTRRPC